MVFSAEAQDAKRWEVNVIAGKIYRLGAIYTQPRLVTVLIPSCQYHLSHARSQMCACLVARRLEHGDQASSGELSDGKDDRRDGLKKG
jgi:hypothetical protein